MLIEAVCPLYGRHENTFPLLHRLLVGSTRIPDVVSLVCESAADRQAVEDALGELYDLELIDGWQTAPGVRVDVVSSPRDESGYTEIPYSRKINWALDRSTADAIVYVDNGSMPAPEKFAVMADALEENDGWGAVYCSQHRTGYRDEVSVASEVIEDAYGRLNFTQVMHRFPVVSRWTLDMRHANPDYADALFWRSVHGELGAFYPVGGVSVLDVHQMDSPAASGL